MRNLDPREITVRYDGVCSETGSPIKKGETAIYYPNGKKLYHPNSKQAAEYRAWRQDVNELGANY